MNPLRSTAVLIATVLVGACTSAGTSGGHSPSQVGSPPRTVTAQATAPTVPACVTQTYNAMTANQRIGTLFMVGVPVADPAAGSRAGAPSGPDLSRGWPLPRRPQPRQRRLGRRP